MPGFIWVGGCGGQIAGDGSGEGQIDAADFAVLAPGGCGGEGTFASDDSELAARMRRRSVGVAVQTRNARRIAGDHPSIFAAGARVSERIAGNGEPGGFDRSHGISGPANRQFRSLCLKRALRL